MISYVVPTPREGAVWPPAAPSPARTQARLPGGRPVFRDLSPRRTPEDVLASHGLHPGVAQTLDPVAGVTLVTWVP